MSRKSLVFLTFLYRTTITIPAYHVEKPFLRFPMKNCSNLFYLSSIACKLCECLSEKELAALSADLVVLGDMLANIIAHQTFCSPETELPECDDLSP